MNLRKKLLYTAIAIIYIVSSLVLGDFSFGIIQFRYAEVLNVLALKDKKYIYALTVACFITNLIGVIIGINPIGFLDVFLGTFATFIAATLINKFKDVKTFNQPLLALTMPALINGLIIGAELAYVFGRDNFFALFIYNFSTVFASEFVIVLIFGLIVKDRLFKILENFDEKN